jgi:hypothetical protein
MAVPFVASVAAQEEHGAAAQARSVPAEAEIASAAATGELFQITIALRPGQRDRRRPAARALRDLRQLLQLQLRDDHGLLDLRVTHGESHAYSDFRRMTDLYLSSKLE